MSKTDTQVFPHLSEILKIIDGALRANSSMAANYAGLLADKLEQEGNREQALRVRERLARAPTGIAHAQDAGRISTGLPIDTESRMHTVDVSHPMVDAVKLYLPSGVDSRIREFLNTVRYYDALQASEAASPLRLLIYGAPGTGKTQTARWIAGELKLPLLTVRCDTLISSLLGQTSKNLRQVFEYVEQRPCVLFLDEFDALGSARGNERDVGELQRVVISLLQNLDALSENTIVVAASNHDQLLDSAIWRRFPFRVPLPLPDFQLRKELWKEMLGKFSSSALDFDLLAEKSEGISGALIEQIVLDSKRTAIFAGATAIDPAELFKRLGLSLALVQRVALPSLEDEICWLRKWERKIFSLRELSRLYSISIRKVSQLTKEEDGEEKRGHS
ncbi:anti-phage ATPase IteA [Herbaspirillum seropedicae]|uniref:AAA+ class ATPase protein n=1 Tax=Herbaspirillum seropedicae (strain SmR1) TaxID=757424 RepID=D8IPQ5_HERSS|nr:anti-phage ATPase IteA [Herbaspirillum seropedicae]ADJ64952.1 AAA+ class ATPase protein [Herbaspirillum seropedicae SmR1]AKN66843.1 ATPase AAA [Herbaspirillum seropedicae]NQE28142.1 ATPase AAA [Herbaspirillum seropedicae]